MRVVPLKLPTRPRDSKTRMTGPRFHLEIFMKKSLARDEVSVEEQGILQRCKCVFRILVQLIEGINIIGCVRCVSVCAGRSVANSGEILRRIRFSMAKRLSVRVL